MIPCPHCEREFEKRAGLMRHVTVSHPHEPHEEVPVNPSGAIEPVVPVASPWDPDLDSALDEPPDPETYAESLDEPAPGQEPYVDPDAWHERSAGLVEPPVRLTMDDTPYVGIDGEPRILEVERTINPANGIQGPNPEQYKQIRAFIRLGRSEWEAWMNVVGHEPPPRPPQPVDERPLRLQQVAFRVRNGGTDQIDARWLLQLAEIGAEAIGVFEVLRKEADVGPSTDALIERWKAAIQ